MGRSIPQLVRENCTAVLVGKGITQWRQVLAESRLAECLEPVVVALPSEATTAPAQFRRPFPVADCNIFTAPYDASDCAFVSSLIEGWAPMVLVCDSHPMKPRPIRLGELLGLGRTAWNWKINTASLGSPQARMRRVHVSGRGGAPVSSRMVILLLLDLALPVSVADCLEAASGETEFLEGTVAITTVSTQHVTEPESLGYIHLPRGKPSCGVRWRVKDKEHVVSARQGGMVTAWGGKRLRSSKSGDGDILPTNYQVCNVRGVSFSVSSKVYPSGMGHTLIFDSHHC